jgi:predicted dienelactone hydrolase
MSTRKVYIVLLITALIVPVLAIHTSVVAQGNEPPAVGLRPDAPPYAAHGPYWVGTRDLVIDEGTENAITITVWYPALNPDGLKEETTYTIEETSPVVAFIGATEPLTVQGFAIRDAEPDKANAPYPLVVFSPGLAMWRQSETYPLEHLASYGFVVISSDPRGETWEEFWAGAATRPLDTQRVIDYANTSAAADSSLTGVIDTERIAIMGHSSGGWTALVGGGAQMNLGWCAAHPEEVAQNPMGDCSQFVPHQDEIAQMMGLDSTPSGMWPPMNDPRVDAVISLAPDGDIWGENYEGVEALTVPVLLMGGSGDTSNVPELCSYPIYEHLVNANKTFVVLENAEHTVFGNPVSTIPWLDTSWFSTFTDPVWDMARAHDLINHFVTAFLLSVLKGDPDATAALAPDAVQFPGISYETTGF